MTPLLLAMDGGGVGCWKFPGELSTSFTFQRIRDLLAEPITNPLRREARSNMVDHDCEGCGTLSFRPTSQGKGEIERARRTSDQGGMFDHDANGASPLIAS